MSPNGTLTWQAGVFDGVPDLGNGDGDVSDAKDFAGRVFVQPFRAGSLQGFGVGVAGTTGLERGTTAAPALAGYRTAGQQTFFRYASSASTAANNAYANGRRARLAPQAVSVYRLARRPWRIHPVVAGGDPYGRDGEAQAYGLADDRLRAF